MRLAGRLSVAQVPELLEACAEALPLEVDLADLVSADAAGIKNASATTSPWRNAGRRSRIPPVEDRLAGWTGGQRVAAEGNPVEEH